MDADLEDLAKSVNRLMMDSARSEDPENARFCETQALIEIGVAILHELRAIRTELRDGE